MSVRKIANSLGLSREELPQILDRKDFVEWLRTRGVAVSYVPVRYAELTASQAEYESDKVDDLASSTLAYVVSKPLVVARDNYILDGHHRWLAALQVDPDVVGWSYKVDCPFTELLKRVREYDGAVNRKVTESSDRNFL